jgi:hypothetical protein
LQICACTKSQGIEVFTVAFGTPLLTSDAVLSGCASGADDYFSAANAEKWMMLFRRLQTYRSSSSLWSEGLPRR